VVADHDSADTEMLGHMGVGAAGWQASLSKESVGHPDRVFTLLAAQEALPSPLARSHALEMVWLLAALEGLPALDVSDEEEAIQTGCQHAMIGASSVARGEPFKSERNARPGVISGRREFSLSAFAFLAFVADFCSSWSSLPDLSYPRPRVN
jgi:hypothetical protein